ARFPLRQERPRRVSHGGGLPHRLLDAHGARHRHLDPGGLAPGLPRRPGDAMEDGAMRIGARLAIWAALPAPPPPWVFGVWAGPPGSSAAWREARRLSDLGRYDAALAVVADALARDPGNPELLWLQAGVTGWAGRHRDSVALYTRLQAAHPEMA